MTQEEKLLKLLQVAVNNNWKPTCRLQEYIIYQEESFEIKSDGCVHDYQVHEEHKSFSLNDLVTNWEEGEVSFIEALCKTIQHCPAYDIIGNDEFEPRNIRNLKETDSYTIQWVLLPTSKRLDFLFTTFNHLLK